MNNKALVEIYVPAADKKYDVFIPLDSKMHEVVMLVSEAMSDLSEDKYKADQNAVLCDYDTGIIYNSNLEVYELGIKNGSRLMLI